MQKARIRISSYNTLFKENNCFFQTCKRFKTLRHKERKLVHVPPTIIYNTVKNVGNYKNFVPYCFKSIVTSEKEFSSTAQLGVGFGPVKEHYTSLLKFNDTKFVEAHCMDGKLFNSLICLWKFNPVSSKPDITIIDFQIEFEFKSRLHSKLATLFFNEIVRTMVKAFEKEAKNQFEVEKLNK